MRLFSFSGHLNLLLLEQSDYTLLLTASKQGNIHKKTLIVLDTVAGEFLRSKDCRDSCGNSVMCRGLLS